MIGTASASSKDHEIDLTPPTNFVQTEVGRGLADVFEPGLVTLLEDLEDAADAEATRRIYQAQGVAAFPLHRP